MRLSGATMTPDSLTPSPPPATINHPDSEKVPLLGRDKKLTQTILVSQTTSAV